MVGVEGVVGQVVGVVEFLAAALPGIAAVGDALSRAVLDTGVISRPVAAIIQVASFLLFCFSSTFLNDKFVNAFTFIWNQFNWSEILTTFNFESCPFLLH